MAQEHEILAYILHSELIGLVQLWIILEVGLEFKCILAICTKVF